MGRRKDAANQRKHGVGFESAARVFADPDYVLGKTDTDEGGETRWHAIGLVEAVLLLVVHVYSSSYRWPRNHPHPGTGRNRVSGPKDS